MYTYALIYIYICRIHIQFTHINFLYRHMHMQHTLVYTCTHMHYTNTLSHTGHFMTVPAHVRTSININEVMSPGCSETHVLRGRGEGWQGGEDGAVAAEEQLIIRLTEV